MQILDSRHSRRHSDTFDQEPLIGADVETTPFVASSGNQRRSVIQGVIFGLAGLVFVGLLVAVIVLAVRDADRSTHKTVYPAAESEPMMVETALVDLGMVAPDGVETAESTEMVFDCAVAKASLCDDHPENCLAPDELDRALCLNGQPQSNGAMAQCICTDTETVNTLDEAPLVDAAIENLGDEFEYVEELPDGSEGQVVDADDVDHVDDFAFRRWRRRRKPKPWRCNRFLRKLCRRGVKKCRLFDRLTAHLCDQQTGESLFPNSRKANCICSKFEPQPPPPPPECDLCGTHKLGGMMLDHPDGNARDPTYCLRLDNFVDAVGPGKVTFSCESTSHPSAGVVWEYDGAGTYTFSGKVFGGLDVGSTWNSPQLYDVSATFSGYECCRIYGHLEHNLCTEALHGGLTISRSDGSGDVYDFTPKANSKGDSSFIGFEHRGVDGVSQWGWLMGPAASGTRDILSTLQCEKVFPPPPPSPPPPSPSPPPPSPPPPSPSGACCNAFDGSCDDPVLESACVGECLTFTADASCNEVSCQKLQVTIDETVVSVRGVIIQASVSPVQANVIYDFVLYKDGSSTSAVPVPENPSGGPVQFQITESGTYSVRVTTVGGSISGCQSMVSNEFEYVFEKYCCTRSSGGGTLGGDVQPAARKLLRTGGGVVNQLLDKDCVLSPIDPSTTAEYGQCQLSDCTVGVPCDFTGACCRKSGNPDDGMTASCNDPVDESDCQEAGDTFFFDQTCAGDDQTPAIVCMECAMTVSVSVSNEESSPGQVTLTASPADNVGSVSYQWSGPGIVGSTTGASIVVNTDGTYLVEATDETGCIADASQPVDIVCDQGLPVTASIVANPATGPYAFDQVVTLTGQGFGGSGVYDYVWGGPVTATANDNVVTVEANGATAVQVTLDVSSGICGSAEQVTLELQFESQTTWCCKPVTQLSNDRYVGGTGRIPRKILQVTGDAATAGATTAAITTAGVLTLGTTGTGTTGVATDQTTCVASATNPADSGAYSECVIADCDAGGPCDFPVQCTLSAVVTPATPTFVVGQPTVLTVSPFGNNGPVTVSSSVGIVSGTSITITPTNENPFLVDITVSDSEPVGCNTVLTVGPFTPVCDLNVAASFDDNGDGTAELIATVTGGSSAGAVVEWFFDEGLTSAVATPTSVPAGTYYVRVTAGVCVVEAAVVVEVPLLGACVERIDGTCSQTLETECQDPCQTFTLFTPCPTSPVAFTVSAMEASTTPTSATLQAVTMGLIGPTTYQWKLDGENVGGTDATYVASESGGYTVVVTDAGCVVESQTSVVVDIACSMDDFVVGEIVADPLGAINPGSNDDSTQVALSVTATGGSGVYTYDWTGPNGFTGSGPFVTVDASGTYMVTVTDDNGCGDAMGRTIDICVFSAQLSAEPEDNGIVTLTTTDDGDSGFVTYTINPTDGTTDLGAGMFDVTEPASYTVTATDELGCEATTNFINVAIVCDSDVSVVIEVSPSATVYDFGTPVTLTAVPSGGAGTGTYTYQWFNDLSPIAGATGSTYITDAELEGQQIFTVDVMSSSNGITCELGTETIQLEFENDPCPDGPLAAFLTASPPSPAPFGTSVTLAASASGGSNSFTFTLLGGSGTPQSTTTTSTEFVVSAAGTYSVQVDDVESRCGTVTTDSIVVSFAPATGACCDGQGGCAAQTEADCLAAGSTYQGDGTDCSTANICPAPPAEALFCDEGLGPDAGNAYVDGTALAYFAFETSTTPLMTPELNLVSGTSYLLSFAGTYAPWPIPNAVVTRPPGYNTASNNGNGLAFSTTTPFLITQPSFDDVGPWSAVDTTTGVPGDDYEARRIEFYVRFNTFNQYVQIGSTILQGSEPTYLRMRPDSVSIEGFDGSSMVCPIPPVPLGKVVYFSVVTNSLAVGSTNGNAWLNSVTVGTTTTLCPLVTPNDAVSYRRPIRGLEIGAQPDGDTVYIDEYFVRSLGFSLSPGIAPVPAASDCLCLDPSPPSVQPAAQVVLRSSPVSDSTQTTGAVLTRDEVAICDFGTIGQVSINVRDVRTGASIRSGVIVVDMVSPTVVFCKSSPDGNTIVVGLNSRIYTVDSSLLTVQNSRQTNADSNDLIDLTVSNDAVFYISLDLVYRSPLDLQTVSSNFLQNIEKIVYNLPNNKLYGVSRFSIVDYNPTNLNEIRTVGFPPLDGRSIQSVVGLDVADNGDVFLVFKDSALVNYLFLTAEFDNLVFPSRASVLPTRTFSPCIAFGNTALAFFDDGSTVRSIYLDATSASGGGLEAGSTNFLTGVQIPSGFVSNGIAGPQVVSSNDGTAVVFSVDSFGLIAYAGQLLDSEQ
jgi:hypothetical protein